MKKAMKKIVALALSSMTALSVFAASASAMSYNSDWNSYYCNYCGKWHYAFQDEYKDHYNWYYGSYYGYYSRVTLTAKQYVTGKITASVPNGATVVSYKWTKCSKNIDTEGADKSYVTFKEDGPYKATCTVTFEYQVSSTRTITETVTVSIEGPRVYSLPEDAGNDRLTNTVTAYGKYWNNDWYDDWYWTYPWYDDDYWYPPYSYRYEYTVDWSTDTYYYDGEKHVPTATVTVGKRTIELNVSLTSGNGIDVGRHRVVARVPSGYSGIKLDGASLYYNIEEPLKSGFVYEDGYTYYYEGGKAVTGWKTIDGDTYYFAKDGKATKGWKWLNNAWYYFGSDGKMMTEWVRDGGKIYYCYDSGVMAKSTWLKLDGYWYYFYNDGRMAESEWVLSGGKWYFLAGDGRMATNTTIPGGYYVDSTGAWVK